MRAPREEGNVLSFNMPPQMADPRALAPDEFNRGPATTPGLADHRILFASLRVVTALAVAFTFGNALWAAWDQGTTYDEFYHLEWPRRLLHGRIDERASAYRFDSKTPALLPAVLTIYGLEQLGIEGEQAVRFAGRLASIGYFALCLGLVALLARPFGRAAAWLAVLLVALDPNMAAHASIATTDVAYASAVLLAAWAMRRGHGSLGSSLRLGAVVGFAFAVKFTAVLLVPVALFSVTRAGRPKAASALLRGLGMAVAACLSASGLYLFVGVGAPLGSMQFRTPGWLSLSQAWPALPMPFPRSILTGIDLSMDHNAHTGWSCYLFGNTHPGGVWYYFVANWLMKTPVALLAAVIAGVWKARTSRSDESVRIMASLFAIHLFYFSFLFSTQIGLRYALLCIPLASVIAAVGLARLPVRPARWLLALAVLALAERAPYWGDPIAFTNLTVWPKSRAYWYTADSNLDYGQNRERLERYVKQSGLAAVIDQTTVTPGLYVTDANNLTTFGNFRSHRWLIDHDIPATSFGSTHFGFSITGERFEAYMNDTRLTPSLSSFDEVCAGDLLHYPPGTQIPFTRTDHPGEARLWVICVRSKKGVDLGFRVRQGRAFFGRVVSEGSCSTDFLQENQATWVRVPPVLAAARKRVKTAVVSGPRLRRSSAQQGA